jgi:hypothetical protein
VRYDWRDLGHLSLPHISFHWRAFKAHQKVHHLSVMEQKTAQRRGINQDLSGSSPEEFPIGNKSALRNLIESDLPACGVEVRRATRRSISNLSRQLLRGCFHFHVKFRGLRWEGWAVVCDATVVIVKTLTWGNLFAIDEEEGASLGQ